MPPDGQNYDHRYEESFEDARRELGLGGYAFNYVWGDIAQTLDENPYNVYVREVPNSDGFRVYPTLPLHEDFLSCVVYFCVEEEAKCIRYFGLEGLTDDWTYAPLDP